MHDTGGQGLRFDTGEEGRFNRSNHLQFNVAFRNPNGGLSGKSDASSTYRNTGTDNQRGLDPELQLTTSLGLHRPRGRPGLQTFALHRRASSPRFTEGAADIKVCRCYPASCTCEHPDPDPHPNHIKVCRCCYPARCTCHTLTLTLTLTTSRSAATATPASCTCHTRTLALTLTTSRSAAATPRAARGGATTPPSPPSPTAAR